MRGNLHMVTELINECMDYGVVTQLQQHIVLERLHSRYLPPKQPMFEMGRSGSQRSSHFRCAALILLCWPSAKNPTSACLLL